MGSLASTTLKIGDLAPTFTLPDLDGRPFELADVLQGGTVLLVFAPGAWSTSTRRQIAELEAIHEQLDELDVIALMIVTQKAANARRTLHAALSRPDQDLTRPVLSFPILVDQHREVARDYGVFRSLSLQGFRVTRPAAFLIDPTEEIHFVYVGQSDADIPDTLSLLRIARSLARPTLVSIAPLLHRSQRFVQGWDVSALPRLASRSEPVAIDQPSSIIQLPAARPDRDLYPDEFQDEAPAAVEIAEISVAEGHARS